MVNALRFSVMGCVMCAIANADAGPLVAALSSEDPIVRFDASEGAAAYGVGAILPVAQLLDHEDPYVVQAAKRALEVIGDGTAPSADVVTSELTQALRSVQGNEGRRWIAWLLSYRGAISDDLIQLLDNPELFDHALFAIQGIGNRRTSPEPSRGRRNPVYHEEKSESRYANRIMARAQRASGEERVALLNTVGAIGGSGVVPALLEEARKPVPECDPAIAALGRIGAHRAAGIVWDQHLNGSPVALDAYLQIAEHAEPKESEAMYLRVLAESDVPHVQSAALRALGTVGRRGMVDVLVPYLADSRNDVRGSAMAALATLEGRGVGRRLRNHLDDPQPGIRSAILRVVAAREGRNARDIVERALADPSSEVRVTALRLLGGTPDLRYEETFLDAARSGSEETRGAALGAYLQLADHVLRNGDTTKAQTMYTTAMELTTHPRETVLAIEGLAQIGNPDSLPWLMHALERPGLELSAGLAALAIAESLAESDPERARKTCLAMLDRMPPRDLARRIGQHLDAMGVSVDPRTRGGFITQWELIGPFPATSFDVVYAPEIEYRPAAMYDGAEDQRVAWRPYVTGDIQGIVDLPALMTPVEDVIAYARATICVDRDHDAILRLGSDDGVKAWLNGELVHSNNASRRVRIDDDSVPIHLTAGENVLMLKIVQGGSDWGYVARMTDELGEPLRFEQ